MRASLLLACLFVVGAGGCGNGPSLVVVDVSADMPLDGVTVFSVQAVAGGKTATFTIDAPSGSFSLNPSTQTFGIDLPKGTTGVISVSIDALDATGGTVASGSGSATVKPGSRTDLPLELTVAGGVGNDLGTTPDLGGGGGGNDLALPASGPMLTIDRTSQMFGLVTVSHLSNTVMIKVTNSGDSATDALMFAPSGTNLDQFMLSNGCTGTLAAGVSCSITAQFAPTASGMKTAHVDVSAGQGGSVGVDLSGTGTPQGTLTIAANAPYNGDCGSAVIGQTSTTFATYTVTNVGTSTTGTMAVSTGDPQFVATGCSGTLDPNATCVITVHVKPTVGGTITSSVQVVATPGGTAPANVQGHGLNPAAFKITSTSGFAFGSTTRNSAGNSITFTATNSGDVSSNALAHSTFTGTNATSFLVITDGCYMQAVAPAGTCTVQAEFKPLQSGALGATLHINDGATSLGMANVAGTGTPIWVQETLPLPSGVTTAPALGAVFGVAGDGSHVYAAGGDYYYVRDAAGTWTAYTINTVGITPTEVAQGSAIGANSVFMASDAGMLRSTAPASWSSVYQPGTLTGVVAFAASDAWASDLNANTHRLTASGWATDTTLTGYGAGALWGTSDSDVWLGGGADVGSPVQYTAVVWHRDGTGSWTQLSTGQSCHTCAGSILPSVTAVWGFGAPASTLYVATRPVLPATWTSSGGWTALANVPLGMGGSAKSCSGLWGSSTTSVWFACTGGMFLYTGGGTWDPNGQLNVTGFTSVWGSGANDVYAVGSDASDVGFLYHYY